MNWRTGRKVGRTIYLTLPAADDGVLIGVMDTREYAALAASAPALRAALDRIIVAYARGSADELAAAMVAGSAELSQLP